MGTTERTLLFCTIITTWMLLVVNCQNTYQPVFRLPTYITPNHYTLWLKPQLSPAYSISGNVSVTFTTTSGPLVDPITDIILNRDESLTVDEYSVRLVDSTGATVSIGAVSNDDDSDVLTVITVNALNYSSVYTLTFTYTGKLNREGIGFFVGYYEDSLMTSEYLATNFKPNYAHLAFPCFDEPQFKATFTLSVARQSDQTAVFTTEKQSTSQPDPTINNMVWDTFETTPAMSVQSLSLFVSKMTPRLLCERVTLYAPTGVPFTRANSFCNFMDVIDTVLQANYPLSMLNVVALPDMRHYTDGGFGVIYIRQDVLSVRSGESSGVKLQETLLESVRQLMKQYIGDCVTPAWWTDVWLSEAIATYMSYVVLHRFLPDWNLPEHALVTNRQSAMLLDTAAYGAGPLVDQSVVMPLDIVSTYNDPLKSIKGSALLTMIENEYSPSPVYQTIVDLYGKNTHGVITTTGFMDQLRTTLLQNDYNITSSSGTLLDSWFLDTGYPVVNAKRQPDGSIVLTQERFCGIQSQNCSKTATTWNIPISYTKMSEQNFLQVRPNFWLSSGSRVIDDVPNNEWYLLNILSTGYYRVNYDTENWMALRTYLTTLMATDYGKSALVNKAQLIDDIMALASQSSVSYTVALNFTLFVREEKSYFPWYSAFTSFDRLQTALYGRKGYDDFKRYVTYVVSQKYNALGFDFMADTVEHEEGFLRALIVPWACYLNIGDCRTQASTVATALLSGHNMSEIVSGNVEEAAICAGFQYAGVSEVMQLYELYKTEKPGTDRHRLMVIGLGCSTNGQIRSAIYDELLKNTNSNVKRGDAEKVLTAMYSRPENVDSVLDFITGNADTLQKLYGSVALSGLITGVSSKLNSHAQLTKFYNMIAESGMVLDTIVIQATYAAISRVQAVTDWLDNGAENKIRTALQTVHEEHLLPSAATKLNIGFSLSISTVVVLAMWKVLLL